METYRTCKLPHPYPDKQTKDLYLCNELNLDLLVELGNRGLWPHLPICTSGPNMVCFWHKKDTDRTHCLLDV